VRKILAGLVVLALVNIAPAVKAGPGGCTNAGSLAPFAFEEIDVSSTAKSFTIATAFPDGLKGADLAVAFVEDDAVRYRADGLAPTATVGMLVAVSTSFTVCGEASIRKIRLIRVTADADVSVTYYRDGGS
jgi:hypothetical protein